LCRERSAPRAAPDHPALAAEEATTHVNYPAHIAALRLANVTAIAFRTTDGNWTTRPLLNRAGRRALARWAKRR
jgi:hypothetical protein